MATSKSTSLVAQELRTFVPASDFDLSKRFYRAVGFHEDWTNGEVAYFTSGDTGFLLKYETEAGYGSGLQMQVVVESVDTLHAQMRAALEPFGIVPPAPATRPWGARDFVLTDPTGVRWRFTQNRA